jgi:uncharacterized protein
MYARPFIDSLEFAGNGLQLDAEVSFAELPRLLDQLDNSSGVLHYTVQGGTDYLGHPVLDISLKGCCQLRCQRCLGSFEYPIELDTRLLLCDQARLDELDSGSHMTGQLDDEEDFDGILADANLDVLALLEDEILLSLPIAPKHEEGDCLASESEDKQKGKRNPFAILENLKRN